jgi:hypothetical protein
MSNFVHELASMMDPSTYAKFTGKPGATYVRVDAPLTAEVIERHLSGGQAIGAYVLADRGGDGKLGSGHVLAFDFDDHSGNLPPDYMEHMVVTLISVLNVPYVCVRSGGGRGYHVFIIFEKPKRADQLRKIGTDVLKAVDAKDMRGPVRGENHKFPPLRIREGTGGVGKGEIEIFPKGASGFSLLALPLARKSIRMKVENGKLVPSDETDLPMVKQQKPGPKPAGAKEPDPQAAFEAVISNRDPGNYRDWVAVGRRLIASFGVDDPWAERVWTEWAMTAPDAGDAKAQAKKWKQCASGVKKLSPATFWLDARDNGYTGPVPFSKTELDKQQVLDFAAGFDIFRSQDNETFACIAPRRFTLIRSREFEACIRRAAAERGRPMLKAEDLNAAIKTLDAYALAEPRTEFALRFAAHGEKRYLNLADEQATVIEIDQNGWRVCEEPPVRFLRGDGRELPMPQRGGTLDELRRFINVDDDNLPLLLTWMTACLVRPGHEAPIAVLTGPAGSAKSSVLQIVVDLLDPKAGLRAGMPSKEDDLVVAAHQGAVVSFDNATTLNKLSDPLCRLATGGGLRKRTLFTDKDVTALDVIRPVIIAGIDPIAHQQDLIERLLIIELRPPVARIDDETLRQMVGEARPRLLGWLLDLVATVLAMPMPANLDGARMTGFSSVGERVAVALGRDEGWFMERYRAILAESAEEGAEGDCVFQLVLTLLANGDGRPLVLTSTQLLDALHKHVRGGEIVASIKDVPSDPRAMSSRVNRIVEPLRRFKGIETKRGREREWIMYPAPVGLDEADAIMARGALSIEPPF